MSLGRLVIAWVVVAAWFEIAAYITDYVATKLAIPPGTKVYVAVPTHLVARRLVEALLVTLIASLWFDSLGSGGWWLLFFLLGALMMSPFWFVNGWDALQRRVTIAQTAGNLARYVVAGGLLAWRLS